MISKQLGLDGKDKYYLGIILILSTILTIHYINFTAHLGIFCSDVYVYLVNGLYYSGENVSANKDLWLSPLVCILTSLFFDLGFKSEISIFIVTGILAIIGNIGIYLLFRLKFDKVLSFLGAIIYATFSLNLIWLANGSLDIPAVSLTIWTVLLGLIAMDRNPKYYIWAIIMFLLAFLVRYTVILILPPLLLYFIFRKKYKDPWSNLKYLAIPLAAIIIGMAVAIAVMYLVNGNAEFVTLGIHFLTGGQGNTYDPAFNVNLYYYAQNFFNFLSSSNVSFYKNNPQLNYPTFMAVAYAAIVFVGGVITLKDNEHEDVSRKFIALTFILAILTAVSFIKLDSTVTIILMLVTMISIRKIFRNDKFDLNIMLVSWMLIYFIFFSSLNFKVNRYFIPALPVVAYFIVYSIYKIQSKIKINRFIIPTILTVVLLIMAFNLTNEFEPTDHYIGPKEMSEYIIEEIPDYKDEKIASNTIRPYKWYLEKRIFAVRTSDLPILYENNITYYIVNKPMENLTNYTEVKNVDGVYLYKKI